MRWVAGTEWGVGLLGLGTVGSGVWTILDRRRDAIIAEAGAAIKIRRILVRDINKDRGMPQASGLLTERFGDLLEDDSIQIIVDAMGGEEPALSYMLMALKKGRHVVTANKEVMAKHGKLIEQTAAEHGCFVFTEACVGGGIPILHPLQECFSANEVQSVTGIINGTTNYILSHMAAGGKDYSEVLKEAQQKGYAEADPTGDVDGYDAVYKTVILAREAFGVRLSWEQLQREGIRPITALDIQVAERWGRVIKLLGIAQRSENQIQAGVMPVMLPKDHRLAAVQGVNNGILVQGDAVGEVLFAGPGAGSLPTGSAMVSDMVRIAKKITAGERPKPVREVPISLADFSPADYYLRWAPCGQNPGEVLQTVLAPLTATADPLSFSSGTSHEQRACYTVIRNLSVTEKTELIDSLQGFSLPVTDILLIPMEIPSLKTLKGGD